MHSQPPKSPLSGGLWQLRALVNVHLFLEFTIIVTLVEIVGGNVGANPRPSRSNHI